MRTFILVAVAVVAALLPGDTRAGSPRTRLVDDDGRAAIGDCQAPRMAFRRIQTAVDASAMGDTILVCPGIYTGHVLIRSKGLRLLAATVQRPVLRAPRHHASVDADVGPFDAGTVDVHNPDYDDGPHFPIVIRGFRFEPHGGTGPCERGAMLTLSGGAARIRDNRFVAVPPYGTACTGYETAIRAVYEFTSDTGPVRIFDNVMRDFDRRGVSAGYLSHSAPLDTVIERNRFAIRHRVARSDGMPVAISTSSAGARITRNYIAARRKLIIGIDAYSLASVIRHNVVVRAATGIRLEMIPRSATGSAPKVTRNVLLGRPGVADGIGIVAGSSGAFISKNLATGFGRNGIRIVGNATGMLIRDNDFRGNNRIDCVDRTDGSHSTTTANRWRHNLGVDSNPNGICRRAR